MYEYNQIGKTIKYHRTKNNDTLSNLAEYLGLDPGNLSKIETGKRKASQHILHKIAEKYKLNPSDKNELFTSSGYPNFEEVNYSYMEQNQNQQQVNVQMPGNLPVLFSDVAGVTSSPFGLVFDFGQRVGSTNQVSIVARIGVSKEHGEALLKVLADKVKEMQLLTKKGDKKND